MKNIVAETSEATLIKALTEDLLIRFVVGIKPEADEAANVETPLEISIPEE